MTEAEWLACDNPAVMEQWIGRSASARKGRLYVCACCRRIWDDITHPALQEAVEVGEALADANVEPKLLKRTRRRAETAVGDGVYDPYNIAYIAISPLIHINGHLASTAANHTDNELAPYAVLLRDVFGNPFRPVAFNPAWRTDTAVSLARGMYDRRDFGAMPILADALQDAGCDTEPILLHCRDPHAAHVRGCWVCDLVLAAEPE